MSSQYKKDRDAMIRIYFPNFEAELKQLKAQGSRHCHALELLAKSYGYSCYKSFLIHLNTKAY